MLARLAHVTRRMALIISLIGLAAPAAAGTITYDVQAYIDGRSLLIFSGNTLQWHNLSFTVPGKHEGNNFPSIISSALNGSAVMSGVEWFPVWPGGEAGEQFSSLFAMLDPALPGAAVTGVHLTALQARESLSIYQLPDSGNGYTLIVDFNDNATGGSAWYRGLLTVTTSDAAPVPEPGTLLLAGAGLLLMGVHSRIRS